MKKVAEASLELDLSELSRWLMLRGVPHRIAEENGAQAIFMPDERFQSDIEQVLQKYISDAEFRTQVNAEVSSVRFVPRKAHSDYLRASPMQAPVIYLLIVASCLVAYFTDLGQGGAILRSLLIIDPFQIDGSLNTVSERLFALAELLSKGQFWRVFSPDILHFSLLHIVFNMLMLWILGGQLEIKRGSASLLTMVMVVSIAANIAQLIDTGYLFGGMSGVVYGLVGYCWVWKRVSDDIFLPDALFRFSIGWLLLGYTPLTEWLGLGSMANSAHLYGLLSGLLWGWLTTNFGQKKSPSSKA